MDVRRIACITIYEDNASLVRTSLVVNEIQGNNTENIHFQEDWLEDGDFQTDAHFVRRIGKITTEYVEKATQLDAEIHMIEKPLALEKCDCGKCGGFLTNEIRAEDLPKRKNRSSKILH